MKRADYENNKWYDVVDEAYWVEDYPEEFPNCFTVIYETNCYGEQFVWTRRNCYIGWGSMAKCNNYKFMICEKPEISKETLNKE